MNRLLGRNSEIGSVLRVLMAVVFGLLCFVLFLIAFTVIGAIIFPVNPDSQKTLIPSWYFFVVAIGSAACAILVCIHKSRKKPQADEDISQVNVVPSAGSSPRAVLSTPDSPAFPGVSVENFSVPVAGDTLSAAIDAVYNSGMVSVSLLQRKLKLGYAHAARLVDEMEKLGIVSAFDGANPRRILISRDQWISICRYPDGSPESLPSVVSSSSSQAPPADLSLSALSAVDLMDGPAFESWCAALLRKSGFSGVTITKTSGDQGVDVLAEKDGIRYAFQCKCYSSDLGNKPVQEVHTGKSIYRCHVGVVITNRYFTSGAKEASAATGVLLWDRDRLKQLLQDAQR